jgi:hypothetical protein
MAPRLGKAVTLPIDGRPIKACINKMSGAGSGGAVDHVDAVEIEPA